MIIHFQTKCGDELANLLCEVGAMIEDGSIKVGALGLSPNAANICHLFYQGLDNPMKVKEIFFSDKLTLKTNPNDHQEN